MPSKRYIAYALLLLTVIIWGFATPIIKATGNNVPPLTFLMLRFWFSAVITVPLGIYFFRRIKLNKERLTKIGIASFIGHILALSLIFWGISLTTSIDASLITSFSPLMVITMGFILLKEHITKKEIEGTLIAFLGTILIVFEPLLTNLSHLGPERSQTAFFGNIIFFAGMAADSFYTIYVKKNLSQDKLVTPIVQIILSFLLAAIVFTPLGIAEQYSKYAKTESGQLRTCTIQDFDRFNYSKGTICNQKGCFPTNETPRYFCLNQEYRILFPNFFKESIINYTTNNTFYGIAFMAFFSGILAYILYNYGLKHVEAGEAAIFYYLQPIFGVPLAMYLLGEKMSVIFLIGSAMIVLGVIKVEKR